MRLLAFLLFADWLTFESAPIAFRHTSSATEKKHLPEAMGSGVALVDVDGDGRLDVFFVNGADLATGAKHPNRLYRNLGNWRFEDITDKWGLRGEGYGMGVAAGDYDNDGRTDMYVTALHRNYLYRNTGSGFEEVAARAGVKASGWSVGAAFLDFDRDGLLDLFVSRYLDWDVSKSKSCGEPPGYCHPREFGDVSHLLFRNRGDGTFEDVSVRAGVSKHRGKGLGVKSEDVNGDRWPDILVANDSVAQQLFLNRGGKQFEEVALGAGVAYDDDGNPYAGMGIDAADVDGDGSPDVIVNALARQGYWLYKSDGKGQFEPVAGFARMTDMHSGWGSRLADFDNDGWPDLVMAQGHVMDTIEFSDPAVKYREPLFVARNLFGRFFDVSAHGGSAVTEPRASRGLAVGDLDGDGRLDTVVNNNDSPATVLRNTSAPDNHWIAVKLKGSKSNRDGYGSVATVTRSDGRRLRAYADTAGSYASASSPLLHFGLGESKAERLEIAWPSGLKTVVEKPAADRVHTITEQP